MSKTVYDVIIIGAGVAGMTSAIYARRAGKTVLLLEAKMHGGQIINTLNIANWPGETSISGADLSKKIYHQVNNLGVEVRYEEAEEIRQSEEYGDLGDAEDETRPLWMVKTEDEEYLCGVIIIATGTEPRKLSDKQTKEAGKRPISYCATCDGALYKGKNVVVVGSGNTAKHEIAYLSNLASKVFQIHHDDPIPEDAEAIFVAIGRVPNTTVVEGVVDIDKDGYIVAGEDCRTSAPGIFVAGDCRTKNLRQLVTAVGDGAVAASEAVKYLNGGGHGGRSN